VRDDVRLQRMHYGTNAARNYEKGNSKEKEGAFLRQRIQVVNEGREYSAKWTSRKTDRTSPTVSE